MRFVGMMKFLVFIIVFLLICILSLELFNEQTDTQFYCGVKDTPSVLEAVIDAPNNAPGYKAGETLFAENCKSCHKLHEESVGPALHGVTERRPKKWIYAFVQNSSQLINKNDTMAVNVYTQYNKNIMTSFPTLTKAQIDSILVYIEYTPQPLPLPAQPTP